MNIFVITGSSGSGKTTLVNKLKDIGKWNECISHTTRGIRDGEKDGETYHYVNLEKFNEMCDNNEFVENVEYHGNLYGLSKEEVERITSKGNNAVVIAEYNGYKQIKSKMPEAIGIFIDTPEKDCYENMIKRGDSLKNANKRISTYVEENSNKDEFDHVIVNKEGFLDKTVTDLIDVVDSYSKKDKVKDDFESPISSLDNLKDTLVVNKIRIDRKYKSTKGKGVKILVIDTGLNDHKEISNNIEYRFNIIDRTLDTEDKLGHGTGIVGLICGKSLGLATDSEVHIIKALDENGVGDMGKVSTAISYAINTKMDIMCLSLGVMNDMPLSIKQKVVQAHESGVIVISAVGNDYGKDARYPSAMNEVIAVGGLNSKGELADFSNNGYDVLAPSESILTCTKEDKYEYMTGTSFAVPIVASILANIISYNKKHSIAYNKETLLEEYNRVVFF